MRLRGDSPRLQSGVVTGVLWEHCDDTTPTVRLQCVGRYTLAFRYSLGSGGDRPMNLMLNGMLVQVGLSLRSKYPSYPQYVASTCPEYLAHAVDSSIARPAAKLDAQRRVLLAGTRVKATRQGTWGCFDRSVLLLY